MKKTYLLYCIYFIIPSGLWAQNALSSEVDRLIEKAESLAYNNIDSALAYDNKALELIKTQDANSSLTFNVQRSIGFIYEENNRLDEAVKAYNTALTLAEKNKDINQQLDIYNDWALIHKKLGKYDITHDYLLKVVTESEKAGNYQMAEIGYNGLGTLYATLKDYEKAIFNFKKSIESAEKWENTEGVVLTSQNLSELYWDIKNYDLALSTISKTFEMAKAMNNPVRVAAVLNMFARIESSMGSYNNAASKFEKAQEIFEKYSEKPRLAESYLAAGESFFKQKKYNEATDLYQKCMGLSAYFTPFFAADFYKKLADLYAVKGENDKAVANYQMSLKDASVLDLKEILRDDHKALAVIFSQQGRTSEAFEHLTAADKLTEDIFNERIKKNTTDTQLKLDIQRLDLQIESQKKALQQSLMTRLILGAVLLIVLGLLYYTWRQMKAKQKAQQHAELLMKELHHRVKNNLQTVTSIMRLQARHIDDPSVTKVLAESRSRLEAISMIHQQLYMSEEVQAINFKLFLEDLIEKMRFTYGLNDKPFTTHLDLEYELINVDVALPLGLIINELLTNSFKYAYPSVDEPDLTIALNKKRLYYSDNGKGLPEKLNVDKSETFGLQLIISLTHQLKAKYQFGNKNGMYYRMDFNH